MKQAANHLPVIAASLPFSNKQVTFHAIPGSTIEEIVRLVQPKNIRNVDAIVFLNDYIIPQKNWHRIRPKEGVLINVRIVPQGGGGGGKSPLASLLSIAVLFAAPYLATELAVALGPASFSSLAELTTFTSIAKFGIGIVGTLLISALAPPPKPSNLGNGAAAANPTQSPTQFIEGAQNNLDPYGVVPICLGTNRMIPPQAARAFTETQDNDQYVRQLFTWGYGDNLVVSDFKIGDDDISQFTDVEMSHRLNGDLNQSTSLYTNEVFQDDYNILIQQVDAATIRTTHANVDEATIDFTFPQGLASFNTDGTRVSQEVKLQVRFAPTGTTSWSPGADAFTAISAATFTAQAVTVDDDEIFDSGSNYLTGYRKDLVVIDAISGVISVIQGSSASNTSSGAQEPVLPTNKIRLATVLVRTRQQVSGGASPVTTIQSVTDDRDPALIGVTFQLSTDFKVTNTGLTISVAAGGLSANELDIIQNQTEALRKSIRVVFPSNGTYDFEVSRVTPDTDSDEIFDKVYLTAIRSVVHSAPVTFPDICGTAVRIKATDQLNGTLSQFNALVSSVCPDYNATLATWESRVTSNPASLYRYVLQGPANKKPLQDSEIAIDDLEDWHEHCIAQGYTYNRVIDYEATVDDILRDIAAAGAASPQTIDGKRTIAIDRLTDEIKQMITPRNSWNYSADINYPDLPQAFRVQFRNADKGYQQDELIVYDDGYNAGNTNLLEVLELESCTSSDLAFKTARRHIASARLRPETHTFNLDVEHIVALRGNRISFTHDVPLVGVGDGRIKEIYFNADSPALITGFLLDDTVTVPDNSTYYVRCRLTDGSFVYRQVQTIIGDQMAFNFVEPLTPPGAGLFVKGDLCSIFEVGGELDLIITKIEPGDDLTAKITAQNYAPEVFTAESAPIPPFDSKVTTPLEFIRPLPPVFISAQSDETVMLKNSDGSYTPRAIFTLANPNDADIITNVKIRHSGTDIFTNANVLEATAQRVILTGMLDGANYDIWITYSRPGGTMFSLPLQLNNYTFIGASSIPADVTGFDIAISSDQGILTWDRSREIDHSHYVIKFSAVFGGADWNTAQLLNGDVLSNSLTTIFQAGTYLIKDVDILGNESADATAIITYDPGVLRNVIETLQEDSAFAGTKDNVFASGGKLALIDTTMDGYYYFNNSLDLGDVYTSILTANIQATGAFINDLFALDDMFASADLFGAGDNDLFSMDDLFMPLDLFGIGAGTWIVQLQYRTTNDDPLGSPVWSAWKEFFVGSVQFRDIEFRLLLRSFTAGISPLVDTCIVTIDMPDRIERGNDLPVNAITGATITYIPAFKDDPAVVITTQDGDVNDKYVFSAKDDSGFSFKVYNSTSGTYVSRTYDFVASGYGKQNV